MEKETNLFDLVDQLSSFRQCLVLDSIVIKAVAYGTVSVETIQQMLKDRLKPISERTDTFEERKKSNESRKSHHCFSQTKSSKLDDQPKRQRFVHVNKSQYGQCTVYPASSKHWSKKLIEEGVKVAKSKINIPVVKDHPVEDVMGEEILSKDHYYELSTGEVVNEINLGDYLVKKMGAVEKQAK